MSTTAWTRRTALQMLGGLAGATASPPWLLTLESGECDPFALSILKEGPAGAGLYVFQRNQGSSEPVSFAHVAEPTAFVVSLDRRLVLVASAAARGTSRPAGSVHLFLLSREGTLSSSGSRALSLSATQPEAIALAPCGTRVAVLAAEQGVYNVFPLSAEGRLGEIESVYKDLWAGRDRHGANGTVPSQLAFRKDGRLHCRTGDTDVLFDVRDGTLCPRLEGSG